VSQDGSRARAFADEIVLTLPYPISANRYWRSFVVKNRPVVTVSQEAKEYKNAVRACAHECGITAPMTCRMSMTLDLYPHRPQDWIKRARKDPETWDDTVQCIDLGNAEKVLSDALQGIVYDDDKRIWQQFKRRMTPDGEGRVVVTIRPIVIQRAQAEILVGS
jgi:crossover junction endodeoxyribonuclease RusA